MRLRPPLLPLWLLSAQCLVSAAFASPSISLQATANGTTAGNAIVHVYFFDHKSQVYAGVNGWIVLPNGVRLAEVRTRDDITGGFTSASHHESGEVEAAFLSYSGNGVFQKNRGIILELVLQIGGSVAPGTYDLRFLGTNHAFSNADGSASRAPVPSNGSLRIWNPTDSNNNGLPDEWEAFYGKDFDPDIDDDGDGLTNYQEYLLGTDPTRLDSHGNGISDGQTHSSGIDPGRIRGDANGDGRVNIVDAMTIAQFEAGLIPVLPGYAEADINCDGRVRMFDATLIAQFLIGERTNLGCPP
jgi:hypothetical protein